MSIETRRQEIAEALTEALALFKVTVHPYRPAGVRPFHGWMELQQADTEDATYGEARLTFDAVILVAIDQGTYEKVLDKLAGPLLAACAPMGRGVTVRSYRELIDATTLFCVAATIITESEVA